MEQSWSARLKPAQALRDKDTPSSTGNRKPLTVNR